MLTAYLPTFRHLEARQSCPAQHSVCTQFNDTLFTTQPVVSGGIGPRSTENSKQLFDGRINSGSGPCGGLRDMRRSAHARAWRWTVPARSGGARLASRGSRRLALLSSFVALQRMYSLSCSYGALCTLNRVGIVQFLVCRELKDAGTDWRREPLFGGAHDPVAIPVSQLPTIALRCYHVAPHLWHYKMRESFKKSLLQAQVNVTSNYTYMSKSTPCRCFRGTALQ